ncbi:DISARM system phospholipase D-like protein DrmC [Glycomyces tarimensis]
MNAQHAVRDRAEALLGHIGSTALAAQIGDIVAGTSPAIIAERIGRPEAADAIANLAAAAQAWGPDKAAAYVDGLCAGFARRSQAAEIVWTGPSVHGVPVRSTLRALLGVIAASRRELWLSTYSAKPHRDLLAGLSSALDRGVAVSLAIETLAGAGSAIAGSEPAHAFASLNGVKRYTWTPAARPEDAKLHAKLALADADTLLVTSANFTGSGLEHNLEAGVLVKGGAAPQRTAEHLKALVSAGVLERI